MRLAQSHSGCPSEASVQLKEKGYQSPSMQGHLPPSWCHLVCSRNISPRSRPHACTYTHTRNLSGHYMPESIHIDKNSLFLLCVSFTFTQNTFFLKKKKKTYLFIYLTGPGLRCNMWGLVPQPGIKPKPCVLEGESYPLDCLGSPQNTFFLTLITTKCVEVFPHTKQFSAT